MANYCSVVRTNYFHVKDADKFKRLMECVYGCEDSVELWEENDIDGNTVFGFGCYNSILGFSEKADKEPSYDAFIEKLQDCIADNDAIIIFESGHEKLRYIVGSATIITRNSCEYIDISQIACSKVSEILNIPAWKTQCDY